MERKLTYFEERRSKRELAFYKKRLRAYQKKYERAIKKGLKSYDERYI